MFSNEPWSELMISFSLRFILFNFHNNWPVIVCISSWPHSTVEAGDVQIMNKISIQKVHLHLFSEWNKNIAINGSFQKCGHSTFNKTWRKLKCILLSEISHSEKAMCCMILIIWHFGKGQTMEAVERSLAARG